MQDPVPTATTPSHNSGIVSLLITTWTSKSSHLQRAELGDVGESVLFLRRGIRPFLMRQEPLSENAGGC